jgi:hypothetical protein
MTTTLNTSRSENTIDHLTVFSNKIGGKNPKREEKTVSTHLHLFNSALERTIYGDFK